MDERREQPPAQPCICGSDAHTFLRDDDLLRCPERELPAYVLRGATEVARGLCWAKDPRTGLHCTQPPHDDESDHLNGYSGRPWREPARHENVPQR